MDAVLLFAVRGFAEADESGRWKRLPGPAFTAVGLEPADALLDMPRDDSLGPFHLLMEYCSVSPGSVLADSHT
ncbi:hypothetical protein DM992_22785 [Burkholderia sp. JP2-270]|uniref:hypothetical protein n=1 Tax=Burkholderia sp. JP2-270 TaxID=2217913 RepID=UPI000DA4182E|nr:hypothetical protein [Burkholderia sp. JP2-270]AWV02270.1 hypothetical protein DM992_22785 [Burkholderia sp. JP2-270]